MPVHDWTRVDAGVFHEPHGHVEEFVDMVTAPLTLVANVPVKPM